ncbi:MAG: tyrosine--tRNA ligase [Bacteroidales bacterium]|jgi:tyrosyl-tRNA synthetase|nr:tyrosine--tRNA ligase [Bacteroidales bacterium]
MNFVEEIKWRGMLHDIMPGTEEQLQKEMTAAYVGIDPTANSLHIGHLVSVMMLKHFQVAGHKPLVLVGGATGMIGDPSGKSQERNLLDEETLWYNQDCLKKQMEKLLDFSVFEDIKEQLETARNEIKNESKKVQITKAKRDVNYINKYKNASRFKDNVKERMLLLKESDINFDKSLINILVKEKDNTAEIVNNYDWMRKYSFLDFIRDIGKHITVNYMMAKDSVKKRIGEESKTGMSFTEFSYQLVQGTDFYHLYKNNNCKLQMGGSDQWGNITTGTELIRRKLGGEAFALTCPLITKADGNKFGKTEEGNVWLDSELTSPYKFYQFWLNVSDEDAEKYIKIFTMLSKTEIDALVEKHREEPHLRILQQRLAKEVTIMVHSENDYNTAIAASKILFGKATTDELKSIDEKTFLSVFEGVPMFDVEKSLISSEINVLDLLAEKTQIFPSKGDLRRTIKGGGVSINKEKIQSDEISIGSDRLLNDKYILVQKGKKNYFLIRTI